MHACEHEFINPYVHMTYTQTNMYHVKMYMHTYLHLAYMHTYVYIYGCRLMHQTLPWVNSCVPDARPSQRG